MAKWIDDEQEISEISHDDAADLSDIEEIVMRSHLGVSVDDDAPLRKKTENKNTLARLEALEKSIIEKAQKRGLI